MHENYSTLPPVSEIIPPPPINASYPAKEQKDHLLPLPPTAPHRLPPLQIDDPTNLPVIDSSLYCIVNKYYS